MARLTGKVALIVGGGADGDLGSFVDGVGVGSG